MTHTHSLVEARRLEFEVKEDPYIPGHMVRAAYPRGRYGRWAPDSIIGRVDGLACTGCDHFEPRKAQP